MVLESIISSFHAEKRPDEMILYGFIYATVALLLSLLVFPSYASFAMVTFTVMASLPLMVKIMRVEKDKQETTKLKLRFWVHNRAVFAFLFMFLGLLLAFTFWFLILPVDVTNNLFFLQINTLNEINTSTGAAVLDSLPLQMIFLNNLRLLGLCVLFSFIFGSGAIFILTWNASVLSVAMANAVKISVASGGGDMSTYFGAFSFAFIRYLIHGLPEITGFFLGGLAGGIISFTMLDYKEGIHTLFSKLPNALKSAALLLVVAVFLLGVSAIIESTVTPLFIR